MLHSPLKAHEARTWRQWRERGPATHPIAVVTGGSEGIGLAIAARLAEGGLDVLLVARDAHRLDVARATLTRHGTCRVEALALDITEPDATSRIDAALAAMSGHCSVLVNSAGIGLSGSFETHEPVAILRLLDVNVRALTALVRHVLPAMRARGHGAIINVASMGGLVPGPFQAAYYASKAYVISLSEALAAEAGRDGVRILAVAPGPVHTLFHRRMGSEADLYLSLLPVQRPETVARYTLLGLMLRARVVVPGILQPLLALCLRLLPHRLSIPIIGWLLTPRGRPGSEPP